MEKSAHSKLYVPILERLRAMRHAAGMTTRGLAAKLSTVHTVVTKAEMGERRLDLLELYRFCIACNQPPDKVAADLMREIQSLEASPQLGRKKPRKPRKK